MPVFTPEAIANTVAEIANQLDGIVGTTATAAGASPQLVQQIETGIDGLRQAASALGQAEHADQVQPIMQRIMGDVNAVLAALTMLPLPAPAGTILRIVQVLVPTISAAASIVWPATVIQTPNTGTGAAPAAQEGEEQRHHPQQPQPDAPNVGVQPDEPDDAQRADRGPSNPSSVPGASPNTTQNVASSNAPRRGPGGAA